MKGRILVLDDTNSFERELASVLEAEFDVVIVRSGDDALALCEQWLPDLVVLDVSDVALGIEVCLHLRQTTEIPILFAAADHSADTEVRVYEAGATDMLQKPVVAKPLLQKVHIAIQTKLKHDHLIDEQKSLQTMAMRFLSSLGESGILMNFVRSSIRCKTYEELAERLVEATTELGISCFGEIRQSGREPVYFCTDGQVTIFEKSILAQLTTMGRIFQFRRQLVINYRQVSIIINNLSDNSDEATGKIRDNLAILAETADALCENVQMRQHASSHAEQLQLTLMQTNAGMIAQRNQTARTLLDTRILLHGMEENLQQAYSWLGTTSDQERAITNMMDDWIQKILETISKNDSTEEMGNALRGFSDSVVGNDVELF